MGGSCYSYDSLNKSRSSVCKYVASASDSVGNLVTPLEETIRYELRLSKPMGTTVYPEQLSTTSLRVNCRGIESRSKSSLLAKPLHPNQYVRRAHS